MDNDTEISAFERIAKLLQDNEVEFIVIGGQAETLFGSARVTFDTDICYRRTAANIERLAKAISPLDPTLRGAPADLPFRFDAESLAQGSNFMFRTTVGDLDLIARVEPIGGFEELMNRAESIRVGDVELSVIGLEDLILIKQHLGRPKDRDSLMHLQAIKKVREDKRRKQ